MLSVTLQLLMVATFLALTVLVWRIAKRQGWRIRAVVYGWALFVVWALFWSLLLPMWLRGAMDSQTLSQTFPEGTWTVGFLFGGWIWPLILVEIRHYQERKKRVDDTVA